MFSSDYRFVGGAGDRAFDAALPANIDGVFHFLAKGPAEFIERLQFQQSCATAPASVRDLDHVARLRRSGRLPALRSFLAACRT
jgi:hypothetical protein